MVVEVVELIGVDVMMIFVLLLFMVDVIFEVFDVGIKVIIVIIEGVFVIDMVDVYVKVCVSNVVFVGLNCFGVIMVEECKIGIMFGYIYKKGKVGVMSCSGILIYEVVW